MSLWPQGHLGANGQDDRDHAVRVPNVEERLGRGSREPEKALLHAALVDRHLAEGREWLLGGEHPTFADITLCTAIAFSKFGLVATPLDERFEQLDAFWQRWKSCDSSQKAYTVCSSLEELARLALLPRADAGRVPPPGGTHPLGSVVEPSEDDPTLRPSTLDERVGAREVDGVD